MAYYKDAPYQRNQHKRNYANEGSWDDEGAHYSPASRRFGPGAGTAEGGRDGERRPRREQPYRAGYSSRSRDGGEYRSSERGNARPGSRYGDRHGSDAPHGEYRDRRTPRTDERRTERRRVEDREQRPAKPMQDYRDFEHRPAPVPAVEEHVDAQENLLAGRNPIREALKSGRDLEKLLVQKGELSGSAREIVQMARERRIPVQEVEKNRLDEIAPHHQGMLAFASAYAYATVEDMLEEAKAKEEEPFLILLDGVTDPHNLGAIIRSAECAGAHGVIVPERRSVGLTPAAVKASAGAVEHCKVARVTNLNRTLEELKKRGIWTYAVTMDGEDYEHVDFKGGVALVIGSEGEGISRLTLESCDQKVSLPMKGEIDSLNASVAAGIMMYRVLSSRRA